MAGLPAGRPLYPLPVRVLRISRPTSSSRPLAGTTLSFALGFLLTGSLEISTPDDASCPAYHENSDLSDACANALAKLPNGHPNGYQTQCGQRRMLLSEASVPARTMDIFPIPNRRAFVQSCAESFHRFASRNRKNLRSVRSDGCPTFGASVAVHVGVKLKKRLERIAGALAQASEKSEFLFPLTWKRPHTHKWGNHSGAPRDLCMCPAGTSRRRKNIDAGKSMGNQWNVERIEHANKRIHAGLQLERPPEAVAGKPLDAVADAETADPILNIRKEPT